MDYQVKSPNLDFGLFYFELNSKVEYYICSRANKRTRILPIIISCFRIRL